MVQSRAVSTSGLLGTPEDPPSRASPLVARRFVLFWPSFVAGCQTVRRYSSPLRSLLPVATSSVALLSQSILRPVRVSLQNHLIKADEILLGGLADDRYIRSRYLRTWRTRTADSETGWATNSHAIEYGTHPVTGWTGAIASIVAKPQDRRFAINHATAATWTLPRGASAPS